MPDPNRYDNRDDFMKACVPAVLDEGTAEDGAQAVAICSSMWRNRDKKEAKSAMIVTTQSDEHHPETHEFLLPDGVIPPGWYPSNTIGGHIHGLHVKEPIEPGQTVELLTEGSHGLSSDGHAHRVTVTASASIEEDEDEGMGLEEEDRFDFDDDEDDKASDIVVEVKYRPGEIVEVKQEERNGVPIGTVAGYLSTWDPDQGGVFGVPDQFVPGAWRDSLQEHRDRGMRPVRLRDHHGRTIGGFPISSVREDEHGLFGVGEINLDTQLGREAFSLAKQGVLRDFSVGFTAIDDKLEEGLRRIFKARLWEASIVDEPGNRGAQITEVKSVVPFQDLPLASRDRVWSRSAALARVRRLTGSQEAPSREYRRAFLWYDSSAPGEFGSYKLPIADVIDGTLTAIPRAIFGAAGALQGSRGGVDIPDSDRGRAVRHLERYYRKLDLPSPFKSEDRGLFITVVEAEKFDVQTLERKLLESGAFSRGAARLLASRCKNPIDDGMDSSFYDLLRELQAAKKALA